MPSVLQYLPASPRYSGKSGSQESNQSRYGNQDDSGPDHGLMIVFVTKKQHTIKEIDSRACCSWCFGFATGGSWLCYYRALQDGPASVVVPIEKMSIVVTIAFSSLFLKEKLTAKSLIGLILISAGTLSLLL